MWFTIFHINVHGHSVNYSIVSVPLQCTMRYIHPKLLWSNVALPSSVVNNLKYIRTILVQLDNSVICKCLTNVV